MANELLEFEDGTRGLALNLDVREIGVVILGDFSGIDEGQRVRRTGEILSVPVGDGFLGRVVNPLGCPLDGQGEITDDELRTLEMQAPWVVERQPVKKPVQTEIKAIDAMTPIGAASAADHRRPADRQDGHRHRHDHQPALELGVRRSQAPGRCVYVAVGQKGSTVAPIRQSLEDAGALEYTTIVAAPGRTRGLQVLRRFTRSAIGQTLDVPGRAP